MFPVCIFGMKTMWMFLVCISIDSSLGTIIHSWNNEPGIRNFMYSKQQAYRGWNIQCFSVGRWWFQVKLTNGLMFTEIFYIVSLGVNEGKEKGRLPRKVFNWICFSSDCKRSSLCWLRLFSVLWLSVFDPGEEHCRLWHIRSLFFPRRWDWAEEHFLPQPWPSNPTWDSAAYRSKWDPLHQHQRQSLPGLHSLAQHRVQVRSE